MADSQNANTRGTLYAAGLDLGHALLEADQGEDLIEAAVARPMHKTASQALKAACVHLLQDVARGMLDACDAVIFGIPAADDDAARIAHNWALCDHLAGDDTL